MTKVTAGRLDLGNAFIEIKEVVLQSFQSTACNFDSFLCHSPIFHGPGTRNWSRILSWVEITRRTRWPGDRIFGC